MDIIKGAIYRSDHITASTINIKNVSVKTRQIAIMNNYQSLFLFYVHDTIQIDGFYVLYRYNTSQSCQYSQTLSNDFINATCAVYNCQQPPTLLTNYGIVMNTLCLSVFCK